MRSVSERASNSKSHSLSVARNGPVVVVGGSAAGLFTAYLLAREGVPVQVLERTDGLSPDARTLIVTHRMREILGPAADASVVNEIRRFELFTDGRAATVALRQPDLVIERQALIASLARQAQNAGAGLSYGRHFQGLRPNGRGLVLNVLGSADGDSEELQASTVVGSDGAASQVAQSAGWPPQRTLPLIQAIVPLPADMSPDTVRVWFVPQDTPYFYWLIPHSAACGALGLIGLVGTKTRRHLETFLEKRGLEPLSFQAARIPVYRGWVSVRRRVGNAQVYLVGDAAGQVKVTTVGGIVTGFRGALGVVEAILNGGSSPQLRSLRKELDLHLLLRRSLQNFQQADYSRLVDLLSAPVRRSLGAFSRDDALKMLWRICLTQPRLLLMGLRGLFSRGHHSQPNEP